MKNTTLRIPGKMIVAAGLAVALLGAAVLPSGAAVRPAFSLALRGDARAEDPGTAAAAAAGGGAVPVAFSLTPAPASRDAASEGPASAAPGMRKNFRRAAIEMGVMAVYATARYWSEYHTWIEDWQYELTFEDQYRRFLTTDAIRFDSNAYAVNWSHVIGGTLYYQFARTNYLSWPQAMLAAFINSSVYEYVSEWREVISINDTLLTTFGGYAVGEPWFQLSDYFHHSKSVALHVLAFMNPVNELNQWLDRDKPASKVTPAPGWTGMEFTAAWWHDSETGRGSYDALRLGLDTQIIRTPEYGKPGTFKKTVRDTSFSELSIDVILRARRPEDVHLEDDPFEEVDFTTRTVGLSSYSQKIDELGRGNAFSFGLGSALTFVRKRPPVYDNKSVRVYLDPQPPTPTDFRDKLAVAHIAGPVVDWTHFGRGFKVRAVADAYLDFGMVHAFAFNAYSADHSIEGMKSTLGYYAYCYSYGTSASGRVDVDWGNLWVRALVSGHIWDSIDSRDRIPEDVTNNVSARDTRTRFLLKAGWRLPWAPVRAFASVESLHRWGRIGDTTAGSRETRTSAGLSYLF